MSDTILEAVNKANDTLVAEEIASQTPDTPVVDTPTVDTPDSNTTTEKENEEAKLDERTTNALQILELLEDPKTAPEFIKELARKAGLYNERSTSAEVKAAEKTAAEYIKEELGDNYEFLSGPIGVALTKILGAQEARFQQELLRRDQERAAKDFTQEYNTVITELKVTEKEAALLNTTVQKYPPSNSVPFKQYLGDMLKLVRLEQSETTNKQKTVEKQKENLKNRLPSGTEVVEAKETTPGVDKKGHMTAKDAALLALRQMAQ